MGAVRAIATGWMDHDTGGSDQEWIARALAGEDGAYTVLFERYQHVVARRLRRVLGNSADIEDAVQNTFVTAFRRLADFDTRRKLGSWLCGIAFRTAANQLRSTRRRWWLKLGSEQKVTATGVSVEGDVRARELASLLYQALEHVSVAKRIAYTMHELEGLSFTEIAELTETSPQNARARVLSAQREVQMRIARMSTGEVAR